ncbi:hypothetical protein MtrunA17_Chr1g0158591 [Medicago truncatula]|uniref:Uncharacterized protein n=1 Tax=Medicago truncatula TaxID=3880 RepID=A0A396JKS8_MEDTR|nr:hypothetical protein MtrunA17_Chr1g0158591 [Medicago truncatula]
MKIYEVAPVNLSPEDEEIEKSAVTGSIPSVVMIVKVVNLNWEMGF